MRIILITSLALFGCLQHPQAGFHDDENNPTEEPLTSSAICEGSWDDPESKKACEQKCDSTPNAIFDYVELESLPVIKLYECMLIAKEDMPEACERRGLVYSDKKEKCVP